MYFRLIIGAPGTGKSYLLGSMEERVPGIILAPTWFCARKIGGQTIYNYCKCSYIKFVPKKFDKKCIYIDEVFMFSKKDMQEILECANDDSIFYLFGDPYQIKSPNDDGYFWEALPTEYKVTFLTKFYRSANDLKLEEILSDYRIQKRIEITNMFELIKMNDVPKLDATVLVGTHDAQKEIEKYITHYHLKQKDIIYGPDGNPYRQGETLFSVSKHGTIEEELSFIRFDRENMIVKKNGISMYIPPTKGDRVSYEIIPGDVITINIAQGEEFDKIILDVSSFFEFGSLYTGLSRTKCLKDIYIIERNDYDKVFEIDMENPFCK